MGLVPTFYALRWVTTLLTREFPFPEVIMVWDSLLADPNRFSFLLHVCVAMIRNERETLLKSDFGPCLKLLQHYPHTSFLNLLTTAMEVRAEDNHDVVTRGLETADVDNRGRIWTMAISALGASPPPKQRPSHIQGHGQAGHAHHTTATTAGSAHGEPPAHSAAGVKPAPEAVGAARTSWRGLGFSTGSNAATTASASAMTSSSISGMFRSFSLSSLSSAASGSNASPSHHVQQSLSNANAAAAAAGWKSSPPVENASVTASHHDRTR